VERLVVETADAAVGSMTPLRRSVRGLPGSEPGSRSVSRAASSAAEETDAYLSSDGGAESGAAGYT
jgi:hypothetical protein